MLKIVLAAAALAAGISLPPSPSEASALDQIRAGRKTAEAVGVEGPTLTKHYIEVEPGVYFAVKGARERRQVRMARWVDGLEGDRAAVFAAHGMPTFRHQELEAGRTTEIWSYAEGRRTYVFRGDRLLEHRPF